MPSADSPGLSTPAAEVVFIFDLDGTLLSINSFPHWVRYMLLGKFQGLALKERILLSLKAAALLARRKLLKESHFAIKQKFQALWTEALKQDKDQFALHNFCRKLAGYVRPNLKEVLTLAKQKNLPTVLATAAAGEYAIAFGNMLGFSHITTTPVFTGEKTEENIREKKRERVMALLAAENLERHQRVFFTDHEEDLPLIKESYVTFWLGGEADIAAIQKKAEPSKIIPARGLPAVKLEK